MRVTWDELMTPPDGVPDWVRRVVQSTKVADHLGDVWNALIAYAPTEEARAWVRTVASAEFREDGDTGDGMYETDV